MPPERQDYTSGESTLVPGTLTVYRHFQADLQSGVLTPMNYSPRWAAHNGAPATPGQSPYPPPWKGRPITYQADCNIYVRSSSDHKTPGKDCTCGFYASYDPETDFYPNYRWGAALVQLLCEEFGLGSVALVKAAAEVSGTVVMGRLGVRAEKMKILGFTIDWAKKDSVWSIDGKQYRPTGRDQETVLAARSLALLYGVTYYDSAEEMVAAHPKADVSALGVDTAPREPQAQTFTPKRSTGWWSWSGGRRI